MESLTLLLHKELRPSDVGNLGRIILPKVSWLLLIHLIVETGAPILIIIVLNTMVFGH